MSLAQPWNAAVFRTHIISVQDTDHKPLVPKSAFASVIRVTPEPDKVQVNGSGSHMMLLNSGNYIILINYMLTLEYISFPYIHASTIDLFYLAIHKWILRQTMQNVTSLYKNPKLCQCCRKQNINLDNKHKHVFGFENQFALRLKTKILWVLKTTVVSLKCQKVGASWIP